MGITRWLWRSTTLGNTIGTVKNIVEEGDIEDGIKRTNEEYYFEDNPITSTIYKSGRYDGKKEGIEEVSDVYEQKLLKQADEFFKQIRQFENLRNEYEELLGEYEVEIDKLTNKINRTEDENKYLQQLVCKQRELKEIVR